MNARPGIVTFLVHRHRGCGGARFEHTGDGVRAAFASPTAAVDAAISAQKALKLPVRMGTATGEAEARDGADLLPARGRGGYAISTQPVDVFQVCAPGLKVDFPRLNTVQALSVTGSSSRTWLGTRRCSPESSASRQPLSGAGPRR